LELTEQTLKARGMPDWLVTHLLTVAKVTANGGFSIENTEPIRVIAKREPITTRKFVEDFRAAFS
jgi:hypothetical protein